MPIVQLDLSPFSLGDQLVPGISYQLPPNGITIQSEWLVTPLGSPPSPPALPNFTDSLLLDPSGNAVIEDASHIDGTSLSVNLNQMLFVIHLLAPCTQIKLKYAYKGGTLNLRINKLYMAFDDFIGSRGMAFNQISTIATERTVGGGTRKGDIEINVRGREAITRFAIGGQGLWIGDIELEQV
jgi:hypothetical protein